MKGRTVKTQKTVFEKMDRTLSVTIDESKISYTREGVKFLPAGVPLGADDGASNKIDLLLNRTQKVSVKNDGYEMSIAVSPLRKLSTMLTSFSLR